MAPNAQTQHETREPLLVTTARGFAVAYRWGAFGQEIVSEHRFYSDAAHAWRTCIAAAARLEGRVAS